MRAFRSNDSADRQLDDGFERVMARVRGSSAKPTGTWRRWGQRSLHHFARRAVTVAVLAGVVFGIAQM